MSAEAVEALEAELAAVGLVATPRQGMPGAVTVRTRGYVIDLDQDGVYQVLREVRPDRPEVGFLGHGEHSAALSAAAAARHVGRSHVEQIAAALDAIDALRADAAH
ncbi:MAG: hypothetical protein EA387_15685 [Nitriliruptor sp.]|nr:MAG: hypothetical protein EA387_15685 [Nitriliruptor sp.]